MEKERKEFVITKDGTYLRPSYDENGNQRRVIILKTHKAKTFAAYNLINKDLDLILSALTSLKETDLLIIKQSILFFAVISYGKCFVSNNGRGTSLQIEKIFKEADSSLKETHKKNINLRMDYVAHAGNLFEKCAVTATLYYEKLHSNSPEILDGISIDANMLYLSAISKKSIADFINLCKYVKAHVENKLAALENHLQEETWELGEKELLSRSFIPDDNV
jgi:hypothetical protein